MLLILFITHVLFFFSFAQLRKRSAENINVQVFSIRRMTVKAYGIFIEPFS